MSPVDVALSARWADALGIPPAAPPARLVGEERLTAAYPVAAFATAAVAAAGLAAADLARALGLGDPTVTVDRARAGEWFAAAVRPVGWSTPDPWDALAGDYPTRDGWLRLHTNAPHHRAAALRALGLPDGVGAGIDRAVDREAVAAAVRARTGDDLELAVVDAGGAAAMLRSPVEWARHPQGVAVAAEPLIARTRGAADSAPSSWAPRVDRPLAGLRVLDLTRVLAGPVATRLLAGLGADVLRLDPPDWNEPALELDMTLGKRAARLDLRGAVGRERLLDLLAEADVLVHGYRSDALERFGLGAVVRAAARPGLVDVALDAYGFTGPWARRRGFDSLVQLSTGIAGAGLRAGTAERPVALPVQALDHATGWLAGAAALAGLATRVRTGRGGTARLSLARTALELVGAEVPGGEPGPRAAGPGAAGPGAAGASATAAADPTPVTTPWGPALVIPPPVVVDGAPLRWERAPRPLGSDRPAFSS
jgi:crotonobetainyl-CoA:carnitine CoA-transferase CaiB-like acyl-CoA transferase